jgi:hypothetical protein
MTGQDRKGQDRIVIPDHARTVKGKYNVTSASLLCKYKLSIDQLFLG